MKTITISRAAALIMIAAGLSMGTASCSLITDAVESAVQEAETSAADATTDQGTTDQTADDSTGGDLAAQEAALEAYIAIAQEQIPAVKETYGDTYSDFQINGYYPDTIEYAYWYLNPVDPTEAQAYFLDQEASFQDLADQQLFPEMISYGITVGPKVMYTYYNSDGSLLWTHTFEQS